jgi:S1-C subfamily serine protease
MYRTPLVVGLAILLGSGGNFALAGDPPALKEALALEEAMRSAIKEAEPAVACILVSRHEVYAQLGCGPTADAPGQLGAFDPDDLLRRVPFGDLRELQQLMRKLTLSADRQRFEESQRIRIRDRLKQFDLAHPAYVPESYGSGVVIDPAGLILTNYHVVREATKVYVRLPGGKGSYADIHAADPRSDLAVLRVIDPRILPLRPIKLGDGARVEKGQWVLSVANPFAAGFRDGSPSAAWGILSNVRRRAPSSPSEDELTKTLHHYGTLLQTDARLNVGCSGGALLNLRGEMIGLTTALAALHGTDTAGGFAVPLDANLLRVIHVLKRGEEVEYGFLGVQLDEPNSHGPEGAVVRGVTLGSPAERARLQAGDRILAVNEVRIRDNDELFLAVGTLLAGSEVRLEVVRGARRISEVPVTLAKFYVPGKILAAHKPAPVRGLRVDYTSILSRRSRAGSIPQGVVIREVVPDSRAGTARLQVDTVISHVNGRPVHTPAEFYREMGRVTGPVELTLAGSHAKVKLD